MFASHEPSSVHYSDNVNGSPDLSGSPVLPVPSTNVDSFLSVDEALIRIGSGRGAVSFPIIVRRGDETVTVVPLPNIRPEKGVSALVVYEDGTSQRYEQITILTGGGAVALVSGTITELFA